MKISVLEKSEKLTRVCGDPDKEATGAYTGDLLSWVMSHANAGDVWVTIMSNVNVIAVASLTECACIVMCEGVTPEDDVISVAAEKGVTVYRTELSSFDACVLVSELLSGNE